MTAVSDAMPAIAASVPPGADTAILLALYNGAPHLQAQLESFTAQSFQDWELIVSDDGSTDEGLAILQAWAARHQDMGQRPHRLTLLQGPQQGFVGNFFHLLRHVPATARHAALSDQDDVWFAEKLARAREALAAVPSDRPALYCARSLITDEKLRPLRLSTRFTRPAAFPNALVQSIGGGNTMVLNRAAIDLVREAVLEAQDVAAHDWWLYQLITGAGGVVLRDPEAVLQYRQHGGNAIGANTSLKARLHRILFIMGRRFSSWNEINLRALAASAHRFTPEARASLEAYAAARRGGLRARLCALRHSGAYRQSSLGTLALYIACIARRL